MNGKRHSLVLLLLTTICLSSLVFAPQAFSRTLRQQLHDTKQGLSAIYLKLDTAVEHYDMAKSQRLITLRLSLVTDKESARKTEPGIRPTPNFQPPPIWPWSNSLGHPEVVALAQKYLGVPYVWGGASPSGFDCSGLVMYCYAQIGISLPHSATMQQQMSRPVPLRALRPGDLVFFGSASFSYHVGIYVGGGHMINAPHTGAVVSYASIAGAWIGGRF